MVPVLKKMNHTSFQFEQIIQRPQIEKTTNVLLPWKFVIALKINYAKLNVLFYPNSFLAK